MQEHYQQKTRKHDIIWTKFSNNSIPIFLNTSEKQDLNIKSHLMMLIEDFKKDINNSFTEVQENMSQHFQVLKNETQNSL